MTLASDTTLDDVVHALLNVTVSAWQRAIVHPSGYEGGEGLFMLEGDETPEACIARHELDPEDGAWREVRARRATFKPSTTGILDVDGLLEQWDEWLAEGGAPDWNAQWGEPVLEAQQGAAATLAKLLDAWAAQCLTVHAWEIHPEDKSP